MEKSDFLTASERAGKATYVRPHVEVLSYAMGEPCMVEGSATVPGTIKNKETFGKEDDTTNG